MDKIIKIILGLPKSIWINFKIFPLLKAIKLPIVVAPRTKIIGIKRDSIEIRGYLRTGIINIGFFQGIGGTTGNNTKIEFRRNGKLVFQGKASIAKGSSILADGGEINIGENFQSNANLKIISRKMISIGNNVLISWNCSLMDSDGHNIFDYKRKIVNYPKDIVIGNNVWIGAEVMLLKGSEIPEETIIAARSLITMKLHQKNCVYAMKNGKLDIVKERVKWMQ